jgi:hypothetical protein
MNSRKVSKEDELRQQTVSYESANMEGPIVLTLSLLIPISIVGLFCSSPLKEE